MYDYNFIRVKFDFDSACPVETEQSKSGYPR